MTSVACPHFDVSIRQRSKGQSAVAGAAYMSAEKLFCEYDQRTKNFCYKQKEIVAKGILLPPNAPREYTDRQTLWNAVEASEKQWNAQLARGIIMALPRELPADQYESLVREYCMEQFVLRGMIVDYAIHDKGDGNPHAHVMLTMRAMDEHGKWLPKARRVYILDENGEKIPLPNGDYKPAKSAPRIGTIQETVNAGARHGRTPQIVIWNVLVQTSGLISVHTSDKALIWFPPSIWGR